MQYFMKYFKHVKFLNYLVLVSFYLPDYLGMRTNTCTISSKLVSIKYTEIITRSIAYVWSQRVASGPCKYLNLKRKFKIKIIRLHHIGFLNSRFCRQCMQTNHATLFL